MASPAPFGRLGAVRACLPARRGLEDYPFFVHAPNIGRQPTCNLGHRVLRSQLLVERVRRGGGVVRFVFVVVAAVPRTSTL